MRNTEQILAEYDVEIFAAEGVVYVSYISDEELYSFSYNDERIKGEEDITSKDKEKITELLFDEINE
jgi:hypothetical protein